MKKLVFRLGDADPRATERVLKYMCDGEFTELVTPASERQIELLLEEGVSIESVLFFDRAEDGSESRSVEVIGKYVVGDHKPLLAGTCLFDKVVDVSEDEVPQLIVEPIDEMEGELEADDQRLPVPPVKDEFEADATEAIPEPVVTEPTGVVAEEQPTEDVPFEEEPTEEKEAISEAEAIRRYLTDNPEADNSQVIEALAKDGIKVTSSQVSRGRKQVATS